MGIKAPAVIVTLLSTTTAEASVVLAQNWGVGADVAHTHPIVTRSGTFMPSNSGIVAVGFFGGGITDAQISAAGCNLTAWQAVAAQFQVFGTSNSTTFGGADSLNTPGLYRVTYSNSALPGGTFDGRNVYTVIGNGTSLLNSTEVAVIRSSSTFATDPNPSATANVVGDNFGDVLIGTLGTASVLYTGAPAPASFQNQPMQPIILGCFPEPSSMSLGLLGLAGILRRRR
jgi:uncharacterized protein (TIGR03382 family)